MSDLRSWCASSALRVVLLCRVEVAHSENGGEKGPDSFGTYQPNSGFKVASTDQGELSIRIFTYVRYLNQLGLEGEYFWRRVDGLTGPGTETLTFSELNDHGFQLQASGMLMPKQLQAYGGLSKIYGEYGDPWDLRFGVNVFPEKNHVLRWNTEYLYTHQSPVAG